MPLNIVLIEPEIPMNTGNIGRLSLAAGAKLHLVNPFGFELNDKRLKRAGLDYWKHVSLEVYESSDAFFEKQKDKKMAFFSSRAEKSYLDIGFEEDMYLIFGKESVGLSEEIIEANSKTMYRIPIHSTHVRSLNLANAVSIVVFEGLRQLYS